MAITLMSVVAVGFAVSMGFSFKTITLARQRHAAAEIASARLEHLRSIPYDDIALESQPVQSTDPDNPDSFVSGSSYDVTGEGNVEELIVAPDTGAVLHLEDPVTVGATVMEIYQYATWVDDPSIEGTQDLKRVTVVVKYKAPAVTGVTKILRASSLFTPGTVTFVPDTTTTTASGATTTTVASSTTTIAAECPGDVTGPEGAFTMTGNAGAEGGFTAATNVTLVMDFEDACTPITVRFANDGGELGADITYSATSPTLSWSLGTGDGTKEVSGVVRDGAGNETTLPAQSIVLDTEKPTTPDPLTRSASCHGSDRTVALSWGFSTDTNFRGYRVYRSTDGFTWSALATTTGNSVTDRHSKGLDSTRYYVVGYDKAGNESDATNVVSLSKNQCS